MGYEEDFNYALTLKNDGKYLESIEEFKKLEIQYGETPALIGVMAMIYYSELEDLSNAVEYAKRSAILSPKSEMASLCLFHCLYDLNKKDEANDEIRRFIQSGVQVDKYNVLFKENGLSIKDFV